jgi:tetratricopeptide (TPR) repeat protein
MAEILLSQRRPEEADALFLAGAEQLRRVGDHDLLPHLVAGAAEASLELGDKITASARMATALEAAERSADPLARLAVERVAGRISSAIGLHDESRAHFERALQIAETMGSATDKSRVAFDYAEALVEQGDSAQALTRYRQAYEVRRAAGDP